MSPGICIVNIIKIDINMQRMPFKILKVNFNTKEEQLKIMVIHISNNIEKCDQKHIKILISKLISEFCKRFGEIHFSYD